MSGRLMAVLLVLGVAAPGAEAVEPEPGPRVEMRTTMRADPVPVPGGGLRGSAVGRPARNPRQEALAGWSELANSSTTGRSDLERSREAFSAWIAASPKDATARLMRASINRRLHEEYQDKAAEDQALVDYDTYAGLRGDLGLALAPRLLRIRWMRRSEFAGMGGASC